MDGGAWPFLVGVVICLVNSDNERDSPLLTSRLDLDQRVACRVTLAARAVRRLLSGLLRAVVWCWMPWITLHPKSAAYAITLLRGIHGTEAVRD